MSSDGGVSITTSYGTLKDGDIITMESVRWWPWYVRLWYHIRYFRHNNPVYKPAELKQFVVINGTDLEKRIRDYASD